MQRVPRARYAIFDAYADTNEDIDMKAYGRAVVAGELAPMAESIQDGLASTLAELQSSCRAEYSLMLGPSECLDAEQNAQVVVNGESYFRGLYTDGSIATWNLRDQHFVQTVLRLVEYHQSMGDGHAPKCEGTSPKSPSAHNRHAAHYEYATHPLIIAHVPLHVHAHRCVLWAHNSHVGDACATELGEREEWNLGQMMRTTFGRNNTFLLGFGTYDGTVMAAREWGEPAQTFELSPAAAGSCSHVLHNALPLVRERVGGAEGETINAFALLLKGDGRAAADDDEEARAPQEALRAAFGVRRQQRAVGVCYRQDTEAVSHYVRASLATQFDAWVHVERSAALEELPAET